MINKNFIRNFSIIAHIDHGKSTLADRLIEYCGGLQKREMVEQVLDSMDIERERGITIKAQTVQLQFKAKDGNIYHLNLMDTPGHVDFSYEVSRSLAACEGSLLIVDASQGVEAQTLANVYQAIENNHEIVLVLNKIDLPAADIVRVKQQIEDMIGIDASDALLVSAKSGIGVLDVLQAIVDRLPAPNNKFIEQDDDLQILKALLVDSWYDKYLGVVILTRVFQGTLHKGMKVKMLSTNKVYSIDNVGYFTPKKIMCDSLQEGMLGFITASIKKASDCSIGDTITTNSKHKVKMLPGFKKNLPVVFKGLAKRSPAYKLFTDDFLKSSEGVDKFMVSSETRKKEDRKQKGLHISFKEFIERYHNESLYLVNSLPNSLRYVSCFYNIESQ